MLVLLAGCNAAREADDENVEVMCTCPPVLQLQPYDNFTSREAEQLKRDLLKHIDDFLPQRFYKSIEICVLPPKTLTRRLMNDAHSRYRADKIILSIDTLASWHSPTIALTHRDISLPYKEHTDWGVLGLALRGKSYACVVSTYRLKNRHDLWKVAMHEFIHSFMNYSHCPDNNPNCLMQDCHGKANFAHKNALCATCRHNLNVYKPRQSTHGRN